MKVFVNDEYIGEIPTNGELSVGEALELIKNED